MIIKLPSSRPAKFNDEGKEVDSALDAKIIITDMILALPFWRVDSELKRVNAFLEIEEALEKEGLELSLSTESTNLLKQAMEIKMPNGTHGSIPSPRTNSYYMRIFRAVITASPEDSK